MKGIVFTEFIEMVEEKFSYSMMDEIIESLNLPSKGIYTSVGTYDHSEMVQLVSSLSVRTQLPVSTLLNDFGKHLLQLFSKKYSHFFVETTNAFDFFERVDHYIHVSVLRLYPDAELPKITTTRISEKQLEMLYHSDRKMSDLAFGLIEATLEYYNESATIEKSNVDESGSLVKFVISKS
ncbi:MULTISPECIES: heme NO-binding domain-containing protein [Emticicia]|uniref:heme NO-binding domain-containing protein n=1 Tax=Emticicia TaxID=312278 RepID=UPI0007D8B4BA|nr:MULTISPECIES: heme NO-binding domain-containing protein [Emticicia]